MSQVEVKPKRRVFNKREKAGGWWVGELVELKFTKGALNRQKEKSGSVVLNTGEFF